MRIMRLNMIRRVNIRIRRLCMEIMWIGREIMRVNMNIMIRRLSESGG